MIQPTHCDVSRLQQRENIEPMLVAVDDDVIQYEDVVTDMFFFFLREPKIQVRSSKKNTLSCIEFNIGSSRRQTN